MKQALVRGERAVPDKGYSDDSCWTPRDTGLTVSNRVVCADFRARHETVNKRLKQFGVLNQRFRHHRSLHSFCVHTVANVSQFLMSTEPLFYVEY